MSRSGYSAEYKHLGLWRGAVKSAMNGKRGQQFLRELATEMDAMAEKSLIAGELVNEIGACCTIGVICKSKELDVEKIDYYCPDSVAKALGISMAMVAEIEYMNDEWHERESPEQRWRRMRKWVGDHIAANSK